MYTQFNIRNNQENIVILYLMLVADNIITKMLLLAVSDTFTLKMGRNSATLSESAQVLVWLSYFNKIGFVWKRKIIRCSSMVNSVSVLSEYPSRIHSDARRNPKANIVNLL